MNLVNNQPQFIFSAKARLKDEVVGPDEYSAKLIYEFGGVNVNTYTRYRKNECIKDPKPSGAVVTPGEDVGFIG